MPVTVSASAFKAPSAVAQRRASAVHATRALLTSVQVRAPSASHLLRPVVSTRKDVSVTFSRKAIVAMAGAPQRVLLMGGTRFIGKYLARMLVDAGHEVTLFTRGKTPIAERIPDDTDDSFARFSSQIKHIAGDRNDYADLKQKLAGGFDVVFDINAREGEQVKAVLDAIPNLKQYVFCSSAGVYLKSDQMPHIEGDAEDPKSRHKGKLDSEEVLRRSGVPFTSIRPVYIYGPLNYNPVEEYFFHRIANDRPICIPGSGMQITQLGHVKDLAVAFMKVMLNQRAYGQVYNIAGERYVTFAGLAKACAKAAGKPEPKLVFYDPKEFKGRFPEKKKAFPFRDQHFFASVYKAMDELDWQPEFDLVEGLRDSWVKDYSRGRYCKAPDFECDDIVLDALSVRA